MPLLKVRTDREGDEQRRSGSPSKVLPRILSSKTVREAVATAPESRPGRDSCPQPGPAEPLLHTRHVLPSGDAAGRKSDSPALEQGD